jgi:hypothetical protein
MDLMERCREWAANGVFPMPVACRFIPAPPVKYADWWLRFLEKRLDSEYEGWVCGFLFSLSDQITDVDFSFTGKILCMRHEANLVVGCFITEDGRNGILVRVGRVGIEDYGLALSEFVDGVVTDVGRTTLEDAHIEIGQVYDWRFRIFRKEDGSIFYGIAVNGQYVIMTERMPPPGVPEKGFAGYFFHDCLWDISKQSSVVK